MKWPIDSSKPNSADKDALIKAQSEHISALEMLVVELQKEVAELRAKLGKPTKTPDNSSIPPSQGRKPSEQAEAKPKEKGKRKSRPGAHRPLHPNPTHKLVVAAGFCEHCQHDVSKEEQTDGLTYDHVELPRVEPIVTQITLKTGVCPCCNKPFQAKAPADMAPGSPFGPNLRAQAMYLRYAHCISFERLVQVFSNLYGLDISEGALVNMIKASRDAFVQQAELIRKDLFSGDVVASDETTMRVGKKNWWLWVFHHAQSACELGQRREHLKDSTLKAYDYKLNAKLDELMALKPTSEEGRKFQAVIKGCRRHLFVFMTICEVSAANNGSEQAVRPATTFRKVTNCFRSEWGAAFYADIRSVMETARRRGVDTLEGIRLTLFGRPLPMGP